MKVTAPVRARPCLYLQECSDVPWRKALRSPELWKWAFGRARSGPAGEGVVDSHFQQGPPPEVTTLAELPLDTPARVTAVDARHDVIHRLMEMGLVRGTTVVVRKLAPLGDPMELWVRGYALSIRRAEAARFTVEPLGAVAVASRASEEPR